MTPGRRAAVALAILLLSLCGVTNAGAASSGDDAAGRLEAALRAHPDDPDLAWAWIQQRTSQADHGAALEALRRFRGRWPGRRPEAARLEGRLLLETGDAASAERVLAQALTGRPDDALAQLWRGLALRRLGRPDEAARCLERAAELDPSLASFATRRTPAPTPVARAPRLELAARAGIELDSNVTLDSGLDLSSFARDQEDVRSVWGGGVTVRPLEHERFGLTLGYRYDQTRHDELDAYDLESHAGVGSAFLRVGERLALRLDARLADLSLAGDGFVRAGLVQPSLLVALGRRAGTLRAFGRFERQRFDEEPVLSSLERDADVLGGGLGQTLPLALRPGAWLSWQASFERSDSEATRDLFDLAGAYDHDRFGGELELGVPLPLRITARLAGSLARERYRHRSVVDLLTDDGVGSIDPRRRRDSVFESRLSLERPLGDHLALEIAWRGTRRISNLDLYDYDRSVVGLYLHASSR